MTRLNIVGGCVTIICLYIKNNLSDNVEYESESGFLFL